MIGLVGAHRVGKSTLAKHIADRTGRKYVPVSISEMHKKYGYDSSRQDYPFETRMVIQEHLLQEFATRLIIMPSMYRIIAPTEYEEPKLVFDRTPIDLIGYTLIHVNDQLTDDQSQWLLKYIDRCIKLTNDHFDCVMLVQPGIPLVTENTTSAKASAGIIEHLNAIYTSYMIDPRVKSHTAILPREVLDLDDRANYFIESFNLI